MKHQAADKHKSNLDGHKGTKLIVNEVAALLFGPVMSLEATQIFFRLVCRVRNVAQYLL